MVYNKNACGDPRSFMYYKGQYYINGTVIEIADDYINTNLFNGKKFWKYVRFDRQINNCGSILYSFCAVKIDILSLRAMNMDRRETNKYALYFTIPAWHIDSAIGKITKAICLTEEESNAINNSLLDTIEHPKSDWSYPSLRIAWIVYIFVLIASLIFNQFYIIWIIATFVFFKWRKEVRNQ